MSTTARLSASPAFLRGKSFWSGTLNPKNHLAADSRHTALRSATAAHRWGITIDDLESPRAVPQHIGILDVAQSLLERGQWTLPTWRIEQHVAQLFAQTQGWRITQTDSGAGNLAFSVDDVRQSNDFTQALVTGRWACETAEPTAEEIWSAQADVDEGSEAERVFLEKVLIPELGYPLLDFLHLQRDLPSLGVDPVDFARQRADFVLDNHRGLSLTIEVDGGQHTDANQAALDTKRDKALRKAGWKVWRVPTAELSNIPALRAELAKLLRREDGKQHWGVKQLLEKPRDAALMTCVWGATVCSRIQFLLLEALRNGILPWEEPWEVVVREHDTHIAVAALEDFSDWFGRLRCFFGTTGVPTIELVDEPSLGTTQLVIDIGVTAPYRAAISSPVPVAWSRPANTLAPVPKRKFSKRMILKDPPDHALLESFVADYFRKASLREGQYEILSRIFTGVDVIGLLPTGAGKSLTYQLAGLLLGGLTVYVSPLKSLLQDQHERLVDLGIELAQPISSALDTTQRARASALLKAGGIRYLLVAPERFLIESFRNDLAHFRVQFGEVSQVVVDECHCVSEWGHDFRPAYLSLSRIVKERTKRLNVSSPLVALTGTASTIVLADVQRELGITGVEAVIRAKRLDRDEIALRCVKIPQRQKHQLIKDLAATFLTDHADSTEGLLVFCRFAGGLDGVLGVSADIIGVTGSEELRFFCGTDPKWEQYAAIWSKKKAKSLTRDQVMAHVPVWALTPDGSLRDWEDVKAQVQRQYISGLEGSFRVMVATNAFGMGIDKPSVREVIHFMAPQSPEAYYQEVGRAGRDKHPSVATLLFSDEESGIADDLLSPEKSIDEVRKAYQEYSKNNKFKGGDFIRTFYFHQNAFAGPQVEVDHIVRTLHGIRNKLAASNALTFPYLPEQRSQPNDGTLRPSLWNDEKCLEYAIVRLILLGVVRDYVKDYNGKVFELELDSGWEAVRDDAELLCDHLALHFREYVRRYQIRLASEEEGKIRAAISPQEAEEAAASAVVTYVYDQIERRRRQASRQMLELVRKGVDNADVFRRELMLYLQVSERFTKDLETLVSLDDLFAWHQLVTPVVSPDEIRELHGACSRVLESYPTHPGLLCISAVTRLHPNRDELRLSEEEFRAALRYAAESDGLAQAKAMGDAAAAYSEDVDPVLADGLHTVFALWLIQNEREHEAIERFFVRPRVRAHWLSGLLRKVNEELPTIKGL